MPTKASALMANLGFRLTSKGELTIKKQRIFTFRFGEESSEVRNERRWFLTVRSLKLSGAPDLPGRICLHMGCGSLDALSVARFACS